ncbi:hypothetical protein LOAG_07799 [Loa loa]|uniref:Uncharacterized protein n=1 Tax=Loa loa TaxID=7209 RepID=A0A1S0TV23_LOALO|nr:hypothetical protein LOAG_07799 [Loa loa]EFO20688.1 hypothetical protein LOAG_07799 [Loa loa]
MPARSNQAQLVLLITNFIAYTTPPSFFMRFHHTDKGEIITFKRYAPFNEINNCRRKGISSFTEIGDERTNYRRRKSCTILFHGNFHRNKTYNWSENELKLLMNRLIRDVMLNCTQELSYYKFLAEVNMRN